MNKKSMFKIGAVSFGVILFILIILFFALPGVLTFSSAVLQKEKYVLGENVKIDFGDLSEETKIITPSNVYLFYGSRESFIFKPEEVGSYSIEIKTKGGLRKFDFKVVLNSSKEISTKSGREILVKLEDVQKAFSESDQKSGRDKQQKAEINKPVKWKKASGQEYETKAPRVEERKLSRLKKQIKISSEEHYENVLAYSSVEELVPVENKERIKIYWQEEQRYLDFNARDENSNGLIDKVEWNVPHLSNQTFEIIIIVKAAYLDNNKTFISDIYYSVKSLDNVWSPVINEGEYVQVQFEQNLTSENDITLFPRIISGNPRIEVYEKDKSEKIAEFSEIKSSEYNRVLLFDLMEEQDVFDLKIIGGSLEFDYIVDPSITNSPSAFIDSSSLWSNEGNAYDDGGGYAETTDYKDSGVVYYNYNFNIPQGSSIDQVRIRADYWIQDNNDYFDLAVSWDGGATWGAIHTLPNYQTETTVWTNVTSDTGWTLEKLNNTNFRVRVDAQKSASAANWYRVDWIPVEVSYTPPVSAISLNLNSPADNANFSSLFALFNFTPITTGTFANCSLWDNSSGSFAFASLNQSTTINGTANYINKTYNLDGSYLWNIRCCDITNCTFALLNRTFTIDTTPPVINLISPQDLFVSNSTYGLNFVFNVSDASNIANCSLIIDNSVSRTTSSVQKNQNQTFNLFLPNGQYNWKINCTDLAGNTNSSVSKTINVSVPVPDWQRRFYETFTQDYTSTALINLENTRDSNENIVSMSVGAASLATIVNATSGFIGGDGAYLTSGSISFSADIDAASANKGYITWKAYVLNSSGESLICQSGDDSTGGTRITSTSGTWTGSCTNSVNSSLRNSDRIRLIINIYNSWTQGLSITHYWDDLRLSYVEFPDLYVLGSLNADLILPSSDLNLETGQTFNISCIINCSIGRCLNTRAYVQYNTSSSSWANIGSSGNLILAGDTNPHNLGNVNISNIITNFTIRANSISENNIRCIATSDYSSANGTITRNVIIALSSNSPNVSLITAHNYWFNSSNISLYYNASDDNNNLANSSLILNGFFNISNQSAIINSGINNFTLSLSDGVYNWTINVSDTTNLVGTTSERRFYIDTQKPSVALNFPAPDETVYQNTINFNFTAMDNLDLNLTCNLSVDSIIRASNIALWNNTSANKSVSGLAIGEHLWNVTCWDDSNNLNISQTRNFSIVDLPPSVILTSPDNNYWFNSSNIVLYYNASDNNGFKNCSLYLNNQFNISNQSAIINSGINNFTLSLSDGVYNWTVNCTDTGLLTASTTKKNFSVDTQKPGIGLNLPANNTFSNISTINFNFTITDNLDLNLTCNLSVGEKQDNGFNANSGSLTNRFLRNLTDGSKVWNVTCWDDAGNLNISETRTINISEVPGIILNTLNNSFFNNSFINLFYTPIDNTNLSRCDLYLNSVFNQSNQSYLLNSRINNFSLNLAPGRYSWNILCFDLIGLQNQSETRSFTVDLNGLNIELLNPETSIEIFSRNVTFSFNATDDLDSLLDCNLTINGVVVNRSQAINGATSYVDVLFDTGGFKAWNITCLDDSSNKRTSLTRNFTLAFAPNVSLITAHNYWFNSSNIALYYNASDDNNNLANSSLILNNGVYMFNQSAIINSGINNFTLSLSDGAYNWTVNVSDTTNLAGTAPERRFYIDTQKPSVALNFPSPDFVVSSNNLSFNFTVTDNLDLNLTCNLSVDDFVEFNNLAVTNNTAIVRSLIRGDGNYSWTVTCWDDAWNLGISEARNLSVRAPPNVSLDLPVEDFRTNSQSLTFYYIPYDVIGITSCSAYINNAWQEEDTDIEKNQQNLFGPYSFSEGRHNWTINCTDSDSNTFQPNVRNFTVDLSPPSVQLLSPINDSGLDLNEEDFSFVWNTSDVLDNALQCNLTINSIIVSPYNIWVSSGVSHGESISGSVIGEGFRYWNVTCWDQVKNKNTSATIGFNLTYPDFFVNGSEIFLNVSNPKENENVLINATIRNLAGASSKNAIIRFFNGDPDSGGTQIGSDRLINLSKNNISGASVSWTATLNGTFRLFVVVDPPLATGGVFQEWNETNNKASKDATVGGWEYFYGHILPGIKFWLATPVNKSLIDWNIENFVSGKIFASDSESSISWPNLYAIGKNKQNQNTSNDFSEIDSLLGMTEFNDSVSEIFTSDGSKPRAVETYFVFGKEIDEVPIVNSTNNSNFETGILWDTSDSSDDEYDSTEKEDLVFVANVNKEKQGAFGIYDYELRIPARLREYYGDDRKEVYFYYELS